MHKNQEYSEKVKFLIQPKERVLSSGAKLFLPERGNEKVADHITRDDIRELRLIVTYHRFLARRVVPITLLL